MSETKVTDTVEMIDKWAVKIGEVAAQYGPQATDLALNVGRIGAIQHLVQAAAYLLGAAVAFFIVVRPAWKFSMHDYDTFGERESAQGAFIVVVVVGLISLLGAAAGVMGLLNLYAWAGISRPEVYLAAKALGLD